MSARMTFDQFRAAMQEQARRTGQPVQRIGYCPVAESDTGPVLVWSVQGRVVAEEEAIHPVTASFMVEALTERVVLFDTTETYQRLIRQFAREAEHAQPGEWDAHSAWQMLRYAARLAQPHTVTVLTRALQSAWWTAPDMDTESLEAWCKALGVSSRPSTPKRMLALWGHLTELGVGSGRQEAYRGEAISSERIGVAACKFGGLYQSNRQYKAAERHAAAMEAVRALDPVMRQENLVTGLVHEVNVIRQGAVSVDVVAPETFGIKPGRSVHIVAAGSGHAISGVVASHRLVADQDTGEARLVALVTGEFGRAFPDRLLDVIYLSEEPFLSASARVGRRWSMTREKRAKSGEYAAPEPRQVPLDVVLAGAPEARS